MSVELVQRLQREYDRFLVDQRVRRQYRLTMMDDSKLVQGLDHNVGDHAGNDKHNEQLATSTTTSGQQQEEKGVVDVGGRPRTTTVKSTFMPGIFKRLQQQQQLQGQALGVQGGQQQQQQQQPWLVFTPSAVEQGIRSWLYLLQYVGAYFLMLLVMDYNGYVIICILIGGYLGHVAFAGDSFQAECVTSRTATM